MTFQVKLNKNAVLEEVKACNRVLEKKSNVNSSDNIVFEFQDEKLIFKGTDGVTYFTSEINCNPSDNVSFAVKRELLSSVLNAIKKDTFTLVKDVDKVYFKAFNDKNEEIFNSHLSYYGLDDLPVFPDSNLNETLEIEASKLKSIFDKTFCVGKQDAADALKGVNIKKIGDEFQFASTDRHRLTVVKETNVKSNSNDFSIIIYNELVTEIKKITSGNVTLKFDTKNERYIVLLHENRQIVFPLVTKDYPDISKLFPGTFLQVMKVKAGELKSLVDSVGFMASKSSSNQFRITIIDGKVEITANHEELGSISQIVENVTLETDKNYEIGLNHSFVKELLNVLNPENTIVVKCHDGRVTFSIENQEDNFKHLILGLRKLNNN